MIKKIHLVVPELNRGESASSGKGAWTREGRGWVVWLSTICVLSVVINLARERRYVGQASSRGGGRAECNRTGGGTQVDGSVEN